MAKLILQQNGKVLFPRKPREGYLCPFEVDRGKIREKGDSERQKKVNNRAKIVISSRR